MLGRGQSREHQESLPTQATAARADCLMGLFGDGGVCRRPATVQGRSSVRVSPSSQHGRSRPATPQAAVHVFLEQPADARWARTCPPSSRVYALTRTVASHHTGADTEPGGHRCHPSSSSSSDAKGIERARAPLAPFWEPHIRTFRNSCTGGNQEGTVRAHGKAQTRPEETAAYTSGWFSAQRQTADNPENFDSKTANPGERGESDFQSHHIMRLERPVVSQPKNHRTHKATGESGPRKGKGEVNRIGP